MSNPEDTRGPDPGAADQAPSSGSGETPSREAQLDAARSDADEQRRKAEAYLDLAQRSQADFVNYKRRTQQELDQKIRDANAALLTRLLPVLDDLERALQNTPADLADNGWVQGVELIGQKLTQILQSEGLERVGGEGEAFDPYVHEAVAYEEHPVYDEGQIAGVYRPGYRLRERVLRPAQVVVARGQRRPPGASSGQQTGTPEEGRYRS
ncbi:MAG: nucleotide exchange factor GrpE [Chloroflexi bacterium]|nr:nucleotide exchange factor GrpE [Chloroflexota bacterium]